MRLISRPSIRRFFAIFFLLLTIESIVQPGISYALTTGPHQPEYISYEAPGSPDIVNLNTGDFTFSLPLLEVPGPEGSFSLPLTYNAGVGLDQEASWVGLGWTMNAGAITRTINEFPDDANGEANSVMVQDLIGTRGWEANLIFAGKFGWNNQIGHYGNLSLLSIINASWTEDYRSVGVIGFNVTSDGFRTDPLQFTMAMVTILSLGTASPVMQGIQTASSMVGAALIAHSLIRSAIGNPTAGYWQYKKRELNLGVYKKYRIWLDKTRLENMYGTLFLGNAPTEVYTNNSGNVSLALKNSGTSETLYRYKRSSTNANQGSASDINYQPDTNEEMKEFYEINNPVLIAADNFSVKAPGISGSIAPYRLDIGTVSMPREMTSNHDRLAPVRYLDDQVYKVPFKYDGQVSNSYFHHVGGETAVTTPTPYFGIATLLTDQGEQNKLMTYDLNDVIFKNERIKSSLPVTKKIPAANAIEWLSNEEIRNSITYASKYMDFLSGGASFSTTSDRYIFRTNSTLGKQSVFSYPATFASSIPISTNDIGKFTVNTSVDLYVSLYDDEINRDNGTTNGYQVFTNLNVDAVNSSSIQINNSQLAPYYGKIADIEIKLNNVPAPQSPSVIGGFCITGADGSTYHFALPSYDYDQLTEVREVANPSTRRSVIKRSAPFANTWLLTGITGADFVDRNSNGMIDDADWGYWVRFNYGRSTNDYKWRLPYGNAVFKKLPGDTHETYTEGKKQLYYLNSIETRSSVALFLKSNRLDSKSADGLQVPLRLDEILLLDKTKYKKLITPTSQGGFAVPDYSASINFILNNLSLSSAAYDYAKLNCIRRVKFSYTYDLTPGTINSSGGGKLTLTRVSVLGRSDLAVVPDYKFEYGYNPSYNANYWDAWGAYNPLGTTSSFSHASTDDNLHASAWSLTKVTTPLGSEINVSYEKDSYSTISGEKIIGDGLSFDNSGLRKYKSMLPLTKLYIDNNGFFKVGDAVRIIGGTAAYYCGTSGRIPKTFNGDFTVTSVGSETVEINGNQINKQYIDLGVDYMGIGNCGLVNSTDYIQFESQFGGVSRIIPIKKGGDLRVSSIVMRNEFGVESKIKYLFENGVISMIPGYGGASLQTPVGYPQTPVMYGTVKVLTGKLTDNNDYHTMMEYAFETPKFSQYTLTRDKKVDNALISSYLSPTNGTTYVDRLNVYENKFVDKTSKIGRLNSMSTYDKNSGTSSYTTITYNDADEPILNDGVNNYQGIYSSGALMFDRVNGPGVWGKTHKINRTTLIQYPNVVTKVVNSKDGLTNESTNLGWDFLTGGVLQKLDKTNGGLYVKTVMKPAYTAYPELDSKAKNPSNKNMLTQFAAVYTYRSNEAGAQLGLLSARITTYKKDWDNYRKYNAATYSYYDGVEGDDVWRVYDSWDYISNYAARQNEGSLSFSPGNEFNFTNGAVNNGWILTGRNERYDHFGKPLATKDINGLYKAIKMGYDNRAPIAQASNANYSEIAFSSAEDQIAGTPFFGGEVGIGSGTVLFKSKGQTTQTHTGDAVVSLSSGYSFIYKPQVSDITLNRSYRASVWANSTDGRIYYKLNGGAEQLSAAPTIERKAGDWYQLNVPIPLGTTLSSLEVGVKTVGATVLFDDFRFQPADAAMSCFVNNPLDFEYTSAGQPTYQYVLDNENLFTQMEYNERGELVKTYRETFKYGVKLVNENKSNYRRFHTNQ